jgi:hypothetical protein
LVRPAEALEFDAAPSRWRRLVLASAAGLVVAIALLQALAPATPWPLRVLLVLPLLPRLCPELEARRIRLDGDALWVLAVDGPRPGTLDGAAAVTAVAVELPVRWEGGGRERLVLWRDAVEDAVYRRLVWRLRRRSRAAPRRGALRAWPAPSGLRGARRGPPPRRAGSERA